jgi:hypothetical protein
MKRARFQIITAAAVICTALFGHVRMNAQPLKLSLIMWVPAKPTSAAPSDTCDVTCNRVGFGWVSYAPGLYKGQYPMAVCAATNFQGEGHRPGYNIPALASYANTCGVAWGGKEHFATDYLCLCIHP